MTTKRKRGPVIKTDWVVEGEAFSGFWSTVIETDTKRTAVYMAKTYSGSYRTRIIERKWRVVG